MAEAQTRAVPRPGLGELVSVLMTESMARRFEDRCLGIGNTVGATYLAGPLKFGDPDLPTYIIGVEEVPNG